jgi:hypothetical protein
VSQCKSAAAGFLLTITGAVTCASQSPVERSADFNPATRVACVGASVGPGLTGIEITLVPYRDTMLAAQDLAEGRLDVYAALLTAVLPLAEAGKVNLIAATGRRRASLVPDVPTAIEQGFPEGEFNGLTGFFPQSFARRIQLVAGRFGNLQTVAAMGVHYLRQYRCSCDCDRHCDAGHFLTASENSPGATSFGEMITRIS